MWIKICGIREPEAACRAVALGADAVGLNFFPRSPRCLTADTAADIVRRLPADATPVGLFVNAPVEHVVETCRQCRIPAVQLHGDEPPEFIQRLSDAAADVQIIRAFRIGAEGLDDTAEYLSTCRLLGAPLMACLLDARVAGEYGGTGATLSWDLVAGQYDRTQWPRLILAGGLHPGNVASAVKTVHPWGVDVASGVESAPGVKDAALIEQFIQAARTAARLPNTPPIH